MSTPMTAQPTQSTTTDYDPQRPYQQYSALQLWESLEAQCDRGGRYDHAMVWELAIRACELEALSQR